MGQHGVTEHKTGGLGQLASTATCGNDITSSCLYVSAIAIVYAGRWAPLCLLIVAGTLYLFRFIYGEVVGALPLNGGAYNALLNTTSKFRASLAACLTLLSYMATAVISSNEAMHYLQDLWPGLPVIGATVGLLALFMILTIIGIAESSTVAIGIFLLHLFSMGLLLVFGLIALFRVGPDVLWANLGTPAPGGMATALFFGFAAAMLGVSGFESSANFVEEQREGVFPKTLRNMWLAVTVLNPSMAMLALALVQRMTLDRCLPQFLLRTTRRGTYHRIIIAFFLLATSVLFLTGGELKALAAVYTLSFLSVMLLFAIGNVLLEVRRARLPRPERASWLTVLVAIAAVVVALIGNARLNQAYLVVFLDYLIPTVLLVTIMLMRLQILQLVVFFLDEIRRKLRLDSREAIEEKDYPRAARSISSGQPLRGCQQVPARHDAAHRGPAAGVLHARRQPAEPEPGDALHPRQRAHQQRQGGVDRRAAGGRAAEPEEAHRVPRRGLPRDEHRTGRHRRPLLALADRAVVQGVAHPAQPDVPNLMFPT